jgi:hypothetical protein
LTEDDMIALRLRIMILLAPMILLARTTAGSCECCSCDHGRHGAR